MRQVGIASMRKVDTVLSAVSLDCDLLNKMTIRICGVDFPCV